MGFGILVTALFELVVYICIYAGWWKLACMRSGPAVARVLGMNANLNFFPHASQVRQLELHPVQPWLATASKSDVVTIWDWSTRQVQATT